MANMYLATPSQMKAAEANAVASGKTYIGLMENAGAAAVQELCTVSYTHLTLPTTPYV